MIAFFVLFAVASASLLCTNSPPDIALRDSMALCRTLAYPFCVDRGESLSTELSQIAVEKDAQLASEYAQLALSQSPSCVRAWINLACSKTFLDSTPGHDSACASLCEDIRTHCVGVSCEAAGSAGACTDFFELSDSDCLAESVRDPDEDEQPPSPPRVPRRSAASQFFVGPGLMVVCAGLRILAG